MQIIEITYYGQLAVVSSSCPGQPALTCTRTATAAAAQPKPSQAACNKAAFKCCSQTAEAVVFLSCFSYFSFTCFFLSSSSSASSACALGGSHPSGYLPFRISASVHCILLPRRLLLKAFACQVRCARAQCSDSS